MNMNWKYIKNLINKELQTEGTKSFDWPGGGGGPVPHPSGGAGGSVRKPPKKKKLQKEAEVTAGDSKFNLRTGVNKNPTKLGIKIQFEPKGAFLAPDIKGKLEVALQEKLNAALLQYNIQVSKDTDVHREHVIGFFVPISQMKNLIVKALGGKDIGADIEEPKVPAPPPEPTTPNRPPNTPPPPPPMDDEEEITEFINQELLNEALRVRDLNEISKVVLKEDFYGFINAGQNVMRTLEESGFEPKMAKKYLEHLVKNNIL